MKKRLLPFFFLMLGGAFLQGQEKPAEAAEPAEAPAAGVDLAEAVPRLKALGWQSVAGAAWGQLETSAFHPDGFIGPYTSRYYQLKGNAWLRETEAGKRGVYASGFRKIFLKGSGNKGFLNKLLGARASKYEWAEVDLGKDLKAVHIWLAKADGEAIEEYQWQYQRFAGEAGALGAGGAALRVRS
jgi:hypothetical protein